MKIWNVLLALSVLISVGAAQSNTHDPRFVEGQKAMAAGDAQKAYDQFSELFKENPADEPINAALGQAAFAVGKYSHAAMAYERILMMNSKNDWARLELGRTYFAMKQHELAREQFATVLAHEPPLIVKQNIEQFMNRIQSDLRRGDGWGRLDVGLFYDDNVNYGPISDLIDTSIGKMQVDDHTQPKEAVGFSSALSLSGYYDVGEKDDWSLIGDVGYYNTILDRAHDQELLLFRSLGGFQYAARRFLLQLPATAQYLERGYDSYLRAFGARPTGLFAINKDVQSITTGTAEERRYTDYSDRDGPFMSLDQTVKHYFGAERHSLALSAQGFVEDCDAGEYANKGWEAAATGEWRLPWSSMAYMRLKFRDARYDEQAALEMEARHDQQWQGLAGLNKIITRWWGVDLNYQYTDNQSTYDLYDYRRNVVTLSTSLTF